MRPKASVNAAEKESTKRKEISIDRLGHDVKRPLDIFLWSYKNFIINDFNYL